MSFRKLIVLFLILAVAILSLGCCPALTKKATEEAVEETTGVEVDEDEGKVTIETEEGKAEMGGETGDLPEGFPGDFPIYKGVNEFESTRVEVEKNINFSVHYHTDDSVPDVADFYKENLPKKGYKIVSDIKIENNVTYSFDKNGKEIGTVTTTVEETETSKGKTRILINLEYKK